MTFTVSADCASSDITSSYTTSHTASAQYGTSTETYGFGSTVVFGHTCSLTNYALVSGVDLTIESTTGVISYSSSLSVGDSQKTYTYTVRVTAQGTVNTDVTKDFAGTLIVPRYCLLDDIDVTAIQAQTSFITTIPPSGTQQLQPATINSPCV